MPSIDPYLDRVKRKDYNCLDFVREVWLGLFGESIKDKLDLLCSEVHASDGTLKFTALRHFKKLDKPESPCFVVMQRTKMEPHIGLFYKGRLLHLIDNGVEYQPLPVARRYFTRIGFYK